jgi:hypothetical protein
MTEKAKKPYGHDAAYEIQTCNGIFELPTALVLAQYVRVPYRKVTVNKSNVLKRDNFTCQYCECSLTNDTGTIDHIHPKCKGGKDKWLNVVAACSPCNCKKDDLTLEEAEQIHGMRLISQPFVPSHDILSFVGVDKVTRNMWARWVSN